MVTETRGTSKGINHTLYRLYPLDLLIWDPSFNFLTIIALIPTLVAVSLLLGIMESSARTTMTLNKQRYGLMIALPI